MSKKIVTGILAVVMVMSAASALAAEEEPMVIALAPAVETEPIVGVQSITVDGEEIDLSKSGLSTYIFDENDCVMVPLRAVAEKMGYTVGWDGDNQTVTVGDDEWEAVIYIGEDHYYGVSKIAIGMTAPMSYGAAPVLFEDTTFVPAAMFELMDYEYYSVGQFVDFKSFSVKTDTIIDEATSQEYSANTLIISVADNSSEQTMNEFFKANNLEVLYKMDTLKMYAVKLPHAMTADEMDNYIAELEENENILAVNKDYIMHLDENSEQ